MPSNLSELPSLTQTVKTYGLAANKNLGQHYLLDMNITDKIARLAMPLEDALVVEVGPGPGGLTRSLLTAGARQIIAIEMDPRFVPALEEIQRVSDERLTIHNEDALSVNMYSLIQSADGPLKIIANLPYNVGTKLLTNWLTASPLFWDQAVLMFQKEVAMRIIAASGDKAYGRLAVLAQSVCECLYAFDVPARAFTPPPKVDSAVIVLNPLPLERRYPKLEELSVVTQAAFGQRRKMLRKSLKTLADQNYIDLENWLIESGVSPTQRPEELTVTQFQNLASRLK